MTINLLLLVLLGLSSTHSSSLVTTVPHRDCGSPLAILTKLEIIPPCEKGVCVLTRGNNVTLLASFVPKITTQELVINVFQEDWYLSFETSLWKNKNVCNKWNVTCPAEEYVTEYAYFHVRLPESMPPLKLKLKLVLMGDGEKQMLCESVPLDIR